MPWRMSVAFIVAIAAIAPVGGCGVEGHRVTAGGGKATKTVEVMRDLPSDYPADALRYPGWTVAAVKRSSTRRHKSLSVSAFTPDPHGKVVERLKALAMERGWKVNTGGDIAVPGVATVSGFHKGTWRTSRVLMFKVSPRDGKTHIFLVVTPE